MKKLAIALSVVLGAGCGSGPPEAPFCSRPVVTSSAAAAQVALRGSYKVGSTAKFTVPDNTGSVTILHQATASTLTIQANGTTFDNSAVPLAIRANGVTLFDVNASVPSDPDGGVDASDAYAVFGGGQPSTAAFTIPNTSASLDAGVPSGSWEIDVSDYAYQCTGGGCTAGASSAGAYDVTVLARPKPAANEPAKLDVNFYLVANASDPTQPLLTALAASTDASAQRMVSTFKSIFAARGITVDQADFRDVSDADRARFGTNVNADLTGPCDELDQMFLLSGANPGNRLNLFLVQSIRQGSSASGNTVVGIDGSIPGPSTLSGTVHSGAVVSLANLFSGQRGCIGPPNPGACGADRVAYIAAHETGHFLGLFHTTEMEGADFDPISDTGKCPCLSCALAADKALCGKSTSRGAQLVDANQCTASATCAGGDNLMFWLLQTPASAGNLSAQQAAIMRLNPAVHP